MKTCVISDCPQLGNTLDRLGSRVGMNSSRSNRSPSAEDEQSFAAELRDQLRGATLALIGFGRNEAERTTRTLLYASRTHLCGVVMTLEGYRGLIDSLGRFRHVDRSFVGSRVFALILVGDREECFSGLGEYFPKARMKHIGGLQWADTSCDRMAAFLRDHEVVGTA